MGFLRKIFSRRKTRVQSQDSRKAQVAGESAKAKPRKSSDAQLSEKRHEMTVQLREKIAASTGSKPMMDLKAGSAAKVKAFSNACRNLNLDPEVVFRKFYNRYVLKPGNFPDSYRLWRADVERDVERFIYNLLKEHADKKLTRQQYNDRIRNLPVFEAQQFALAFARLITEKRPDAEYILSITRGEIADRENL